MISRRALVAGLLALPALGLAACGAGRGRDERAIDPTAPPFHAAGDGAADDTRALQAAIDATARPAGSGAIVVPPGSYRLTDTLRVQNVRGLSFKGASPGGTRFHWAGPPDRPMFLLADTRDSVFAGFRIVASPVRPLHTGIRSENAPESLIPPTHNQFENVFMDGTAEGGLGYGFRIAVGGGGDANNEFHDFIRCNVANYRIAYSIEHSQSHTNRFYSCGFAGNGLGEAGVRTVDGSFYWYGGGGGGNRVADFLLGTPNVTVSIINGNFEASARLLATAGPTGARWPILVQGVRFSADRLHADGVMIDVQTPGPLTLIGNAFGESAAARTPHVRLTAHVPGMTLVSHGNQWTGRDALAVSPFRFAGNGAASVNAAIEGESFVDGSNRDPALFADGDTTPAVHAVPRFRTANSRRTVITAFDQGWPGREIVVLAGDDNTVFDFRAGRLAGNGGRPWRARKGGALRCLFDGDIWRCRPERG
jgi:hypothetical protein